MNNQLRNMNLTCLICKIKNKNEENPIAAAAAAPEHIRSDVKGRETR